MLDTIKRKIGVKKEKITILKEIRYCKPLILKGLQKNIKIISTQKSKVPEEIQRFYWQFDMVLIM